MHPHLSLLVPMTLTPVLYNRHIMVVVVVVAVVLDNIW